MQSSSLHWEILDRKRKNLLPKLAFLKDAGFYLAGGTALALQLGHRKSLDFDFYTPHEYSSEEIYQKHVATHPPKKTVEMIKMTKGWLHIIINGIEVTHFIYRYPILEPLIETNYVALASKIDIAAMKIIALVQRGTHRDFIDLYFLIKEFGLKTLLLQTEKKYPGYNIYLMLRALLYFDDADQDQRKDTISMLMEISSWEAIKGFFREQVFTVQKMI